MSKFIWRGRTDEEDGNQGLRWHQVMNSSNSELNFPSCHLLGLACDLGVKENKGRIGAKIGPSAIRSALANLPYQYNVTLHDRGDITAQSNLANCQQEYAQEVTNALQQNAFVIGLGGGHEIAWGSYLGLHQAFNLADGTKANRKRIGIINFDAHFDLRKPSPNASSGTPFRQIFQHCADHSLAFRYACLGVSRMANTRALFEFAQQSNTQFLLDEDCSLERAQSILLPILREIDVLYVTICLDAFPSALAPGVSAPSSLGIDIKFVLKTLRWLAFQQTTLSYQWPIMDIAELNPKYDIDQRTARLAARLVFEGIDAKFS
ncbi:Formimidoylglutamase [Paraglaciecola mesophila]|uniref:Formimidoylglutamase n=1 Tax=Paraglaciecola mesophila TaxID=197222 RepID=A0A857JHJ3_9ALTE|nr:formimidoylglutamase [Paraglaciecola mesophila]QHJ11475.1 Formimidoylglutamase [Paraglaciecola mesophila]